MQGQYVSMFSAQMSELSAQAQLSVEDQYVRIGQGQYSSMLSGQSQYVIMLSAQGQYVIMLSGQRSRPIRHHAPQSMSNDQIVSRRYDCPEPVPFFTNFVERT